MAGGEGGGDWGDGDWGKKKSEGDGRLGRRGGGEGTGDWGDGDWGSWAGGDEWGDLAPWGQSDYPIGAIGATGTGGRRKRRRGGGNCQLFHQRLGLFWVIAISLCRPSDEVAVPYHGFFPKAGVIFVCDCRVC